MDSDDESSFSEEYDEGNFSPKGDGKLTFNISSLESIILELSDAFDFRVVMSSERARSAMVVTAGLSLAGGLLGKHYCGNLGMALGGAAGGICGLGIVAVSMRDIWDDIRTKVMDIHELVYDYLCGLEIGDYAAAAKYFMSHQHEQKQLAAIVLEIIASSLGKQVLSSITP